METEVPETAFRHDLANFLEELLLKIFSYLRIDDLCRAGGTCRRWHDVARSKSLWETVDCRDVCRKVLTSEQMGKLFRILPSYTKNLRICSFPFDLTRPPFIVLQRRCPDLQTLILDNVVMRESAGVDVHMKNLPLKVTVLSLRECVVIPENFFPESEDSPSLHPEIKVLDCTKCRYFTDSNLSVFQKLRFLRELYLSGCQIGDSGLADLAPAIPGVRVLDLEHTFVQGHAFLTLSRSCVFLEELFLGGSKVTDLELRTIQAGSFPNLKAICLIETVTTWTCRRSLASSLTTLQSINGVHRSQVLMETRPSYMFGFCDHFLFRLKCFKV